MADFDIVHDRSQSAAYKWDKKGLERDFGRTDLLPFHVADMEFRAPQSVTDHLIELQSSGRILVLSSHQMDDVALLTERAALLDNGRLLASDATHRLFFDQGMLSEAGLEAPAAAQVARQLVQSIDLVDREIADLARNLEPGEDERLVDKLRHKGIGKFIAYEVPIDVIQRIYGVPFDVIVADLEKVEDVRVLDFNGHHIFSSFSFSDLGEPIKCGD